MCHTDAPAQVFPQPSPDVVVRLLLLAQGVEGQALHRQGLSMSGKLLEDRLGGLEALLVVLALVQFLPRREEQTGRGRVCRTYITGRVSELCLIGYEVGTALLGWVCCVFCS